MMKVDVYLNSDDDTVSIKSREPEDYGRVVAHQQKVGMRNVEFVVENAHSFVRGEWDERVYVVHGEHVTHDQYEYVATASECEVTTNGVFAKDLTRYEENDGI